MTEYVALNFCTNFVIYFATPLLIDCTDDSRLNFMSLEDLYSPNDDHPGITTPTLLLYGCGGNVFVLACVHMGICGCVCLRTCAVLYVCWCLRFLRREIVSKTEMERMNFESQTGEISWWIALGLIVCWHRDRRQQWAVVEKSHFLRRGLKDWPQHEPWLCLALLDCSPYSKW